MSYCSLILVLVYYIDNICLGNENVLSRSILVILEITMCRKFFMLFAVLLSISAQAETCSTVVGETELESYYNDLNHNTCKLKMTDGRCLRLAPIQGCPADSVVQLDEQKSKIALQQYNASKQQAQNPSNKSVGQIFWEGAIKADECNRFKEIRYSCAGASNYNKCMQIRAGANYKAYENYCVN